MTNLISPNRIRFGPYEADLHTKELWKFGTRLRLVGQPFEILAVLISRPGELVTRDELQERLWPGETFVDFNHGLNAAVNKLRDVLSDSADDPKYIETLPRRGYRFVAKVEGEAVLNAPTQTVAAIPPTATLEMVLPPPLKTSPEKRSAGGWFWKALLLFSVLVVGVVASLSGIESLLLKLFAHRQTSYAGPSAIKGTMRILATTGRNEGPQYSPDGTKLVFMSNHGGGMNLWISKSDGTNAHQLTSLEDAGTPRWSPDGQTIAFDVNFHNHRALMLVGANGDMPRVLIAGDANNSVPSWSRDGKWIYFASDRTGRFEVWKVPASGGTPVQITHKGGFAGFESEDGKTFYYACSPFPGPELGSVPVQGGTESALPLPMRPVTWAAWGVAKDEIYFVEEGANDIGVLSVANLKSNSVQQLTMLGHVPFWLAVAPDGSKVAFDRVDAENASSIVQLQEIR